MTSARGWRLRAIVLLCLLAPACASLDHAPRWKTDRDYHLTILHTNDHHGRFWPNRHGEYGMAARKTLVDAIRREVAAAAGHVLVLSGGDINTGVPESDLLDAEPDFMGMNLIGYDAMAVGNHEFDNPLPVLRRQQGWARFPFLSANVYDARSGERLFEPYRIFQRGELRVAVLGLTTEDTKRLGNPEFVDGIAFAPPVTEAAALVASLRKRADIVIAVTHMGHYADERHGINAPGDVTLARTVSGIDVIVGGHSQDPVCMQAPDRLVVDYEPGTPCAPDIQNGTVIVQAHEWGKYLGRADLVFRNRAVRLASYRLLPVNLKKQLTNAAGESERVLVSEELTPDAGMVALLTPYHSQGQAALQTRIGSVDGKLEGDRNRVRFQPTNLGHLIATAQMRKVGADLAVMNSGGIRDSIEAGDITYRDVLKVQPFGNTVGFVALSGRELSGYLAEVAAKPVDSGAFAQFAGVSLEIVDGRLVSAALAGKTIDPEARYRLALNSYIAAGGDGYPRLDRHPDYVDSGFVDADVLSAFIRANSPIRAAAHDTGEVIRR